MIKYILVFLFVVIFSGCGGPELTIRSYDNFSKDEVLNAAKKIFLLADREDFIIDSYRNELNVTRFKAAHYGYKMDIVIDKFYLRAYADHNKTTAELTITRSYGPDEEDTKLLAKSAHNLFWDRLEYLLGANKSWTTCTEHRLKFGYESSLCDFLDVRNSMPTRLDILDKNKSKDNVVQHNVIVDANQNKDKVNIADINLSEIYDINLSDICLDDTNSSDLNDTNISKESNSSFGTGTQSSEMTNTVNITTADTATPELAPMLEQLGLPNNVVEASDEELKKILNEAIEDAKTFSNQDGTNQSNKGTDGEKSHRP